MNELENLRKNIDRIDKELLPLFLERMETCDKVADYKRSTGMPVLDAEREKKLLKSKLEMLSSDEYEEDVYAFFNSIMSISRVRQSKLLKNETKPKVCQDVINNSIYPVENPKIVYYGCEGAYSEMAAVKFFGKDSRRFCANTFEDAFEALSLKNADYAVLPIENSSTGMISEVAELLIKYRYYIIGEVCVPIRHCLLGIKGAKIEDIKKIYSHEQAIMQCESFLKSLKDVQCETYYSTAVSARTVAEEKDKKKAAIASSVNAELYGLEILATDINNAKENTTRFAIISKAPQIDKECNKISVVFMLKHESGQLNRILTDFASGGLNLLKLESRPIAETPFEYKFFADYTGNILDERVRAVTEATVDETRNFIILGNYKAYGSD